MSRIHIKTGLHCHHSRFQNRPFTNGNGIIRTNFVTRRVLARFTSTPIFGLIMNHFIGVILGRPHRTIVFVNGRQVVTSIHCNRFQRRLLYHRTLL